MDQQSDRRTKGAMDGQADNSNFIGPSVEQGSTKMPYPHFKLQLFILFYSYIILFYCSIILFYNKETFIDLLVQIIG